MINKQKIFKFLTEYLAIVALAIISAMCFHVFVLGNQFAPAGISGICAMIQYKFGFSIGYLGLIINIPLLIVNYFFCNRAYALRSMVFVLFFSAFILVFEKINFYQYTAGDKTFLAAIAAGAIGGVVYGFTIRLNGSTGGADLIASIIQQRHKELNLVWIIFAINSSVAAISFFVYNYNMEAVILCLIYSFISSKLSDIIIKGFKSALKIEIITDSPEEIKSALFKDLKRGITKIDAVGMYSNTEKSLLICIIKKRQLADFEKIIKNFSNTFVYVSSVNEIFGNFPHSDS